MKTSGWSTSRVAGHVDRSECAVRNCWEQWTREGTHARKTRVWSDQEDHEKRGSKDHAASTCGTSQSLVRRYEQRRGIGVVQFCPDKQFLADTLQKQILNPSARFRALPLTPEHRQPRLTVVPRTGVNVERHRLAKGCVVFRNESRFVLGTDDNREWVWRHPGERYNSPTLFCITLPTQLV
ncbi:transposable element Tcb1 transposase [Trichonephila clavipes]|nr:transposable element Tcb1 transposase [Trichonephila clavipes]